MKKGIINRVSRYMRGTTRGQAMTEFIFMAFVAFIILFVAIQMAALGREAMALGQLNYQVSRWATNPTNNALTDSSGKAVNSPQCTDVASLIHGDSVAPYGAAPTVATGYMGKVANNGVNCGAPPAGGIGVAMNCTTKASTTATDCATQRPAGTAVQVTLTMDTRSVIFLNTSSGGSPNFLGIPFPQTLSSSQTMLTQ